MKKLDKNVVKELILIWLATTFLLLLDWNKNPDHWVIFIGPSIAVILLYPLYVYRRKRKKSKYKEKV